MANPQLVDYIKAQLAHGFDINQLRTILVQQGWQAADIEMAIAEVYGAKAGENHKEHHTHFVGVAIFAIILIIAGVAVFLFVLDKTEPEIKIPIPDEPDEPGELPDPVILPKPNDLTGWSLCSYEEDSVAKDTCFIELNKREDNFDCDIIDDNVDRGYCYRAKETVLLEEYMKKEN